MASDNPSCGPINRKTEWGGNGDDGDDGDRRVGVFPTHLRVTQEQLAATMARHGQRPKVFVPRPRTDPASFFDDDVKDDARDHSHRDARGYRHEQSKRTHETPDRPQSAASGHKPKQDRNKPLPSLPPPSTIELDKLRGYEAAKRTRAQPPSRSVSDAHPLYAQPNMNIEVGPVLRPLHVPNRSASDSSPLNAPNRNAGDSSPLARVYRPEEIDFSAVPRPLNIKKKQPSAALSNGTASSCEPHWETPPSTPLPKPLVGRNNSLASQLSRQRGSASPRSPLSQSHSPGIFYTPQVPQRSASQRTPTSSQRTPTSSHRDPASSQRRTNGHGYGRAPPGPPPAFATPSVPPLHHRQYVHYAAVPEPLGDDDGDAETDAHYASVSSEFAPHRRHEGGGRGARDTDSSSILTIDRIEADLDECPTQPDQSKSMDQVTETAQETQEPLKEMRELKERLEMLERQQKEQREQQERQEQQQPKPAEQKATPNSSGQSLLRSSLGSLRGKRFGSLRSSPRSGDSPRPSVLDSVKNIEAKEKKGKAGITIAPSWPTLAPPPARPDLTRRGPHERYRVMREDEEEGEEKSPHGEKKPDRTEKLFSKFRWGKNREREEASSSPSPASKQEEEKEKEEEREEWSSPASRRPAEVERDEFKAFKRPEELDAVDEADADDEDGPWEDVDDDDDDGE